MSYYYQSLSDAFLGWLNDSTPFDLIRVFVEMLLESLLLKTAIGDHADADGYEHVFDSNGHACLDSNGHPDLRNFLATLCAFPTESSILMTFQGVSPSELNEFQNILHPPPNTSRQPRPFLLPLSEPLQSEDGTIYLKPLGNMLPLSKFMEFLILRKIPTVIQWYIECILGVEARFNLQNANLSLQQDDIMVDNFFRFNINPLPSFPASRNGDVDGSSISSGIQQVSQYIVELIANLEANHLILVPSIDTNDIFHLLQERATGQRKELSTKFLKDDVFTLARDSIMAEAELHLHYLRGPGPSIGSDSEVPTVSFHSEPHWEREDYSNNAFMSDEFRSKITTNQSLGSNRTDSSQTKTPNPLALQLHDGILSGRLFSSTEDHIVSAFPPEDEMSKRSRQTEEEIEILASLRQISTRAQKKHNTSSHSSVSQDLSIEDSQLDQSEMEIINDRRKSSVDLHEGANNILENLHRYPLLAWHDLTVSTETPTSLLEDEHLTTLTSLIASKCESEEEVEWKDLLEWFVCAVIGLESKASCYDNSFSFGGDDVVVDRFGTARINLFASHSHSSPPHSPRSFSDSITRLSQLFIDFIDQLSTSNCLSKRTDQHFLHILIPSILRHLLHHLVSTDCVVLNCDPSTFDDIVDEGAKGCIETIPDDLGVYDTFQWILLHAYLTVLKLENQELVNPSDRITDKELNILSPKIIQFTKMLDPELIKLRKPINSDCFEEARQITSWKEFLQKLASGEEVENDTSFLKLPFFRPTLLSLQAKFQQLASSLDGPDENSTSSLHSSRSSPQTSLDAHLDSSLRTFSSSTIVKQESLQLLNILHSLLTSPLPQDLPKQTYADYTIRYLALIQHDNPNPTETFESSIFDETDNEKLKSSLLRCRSVCDLVGTYKCIVDIPDFFDRTVTVLGNSNSIVRSAALPLFNRLLEIPILLFQMPHLCRNLRSAFHDGTPEEQYALISISTRWIAGTLLEESLEPFRADEFDWEGLFTADLSWSASFVNSLDLVLCLQHRLFQLPIDDDKRTHILLSFEHRQHAVSRVNSQFSDIIQEVPSDICPTLLINFSLMMSLLIESDFPSIETDFITAHPDFDTRILFFCFENRMVILCHSGLNQHKPHQPPLDLLFDRTLRVDPLYFFVFDSGVDFDLPPTLINTSLCGFHALCRREVHIDLIEFFEIQSGQHFAQSFWMFFTPLISDTFLLFVYYPPPLVVRLFLPVLRYTTSSDYLFGALKVVLASLVLVTAPFGDCLSLKELFRSFRHSSDVNDDDSTVSELMQICKSLEWLNIPTGFGSTLILSEPHDGHIPTNRALEFDFFTKISRVESVG
ncbi:hypothetical protein BLNAU_3407 [Blattamonas nauphoetae]|uniref:Mediator complex subunit 5 n=1 Tax=Blattamonas nauphoetae TaxID=2049346 RepID=A0ABQ9YDD2_9EUKA|nr:hypothetical protein BLNAU_3407 [Blattamonas nauphoetae]